MGSAKIESVEDFEKEVGLSDEEIIRTEANDDAIIAIEASDKGIPPLPLKTHTQMILLRK